MSEARPSTSPNNDDPDKDVKSHNMVSEIKQEIIDDLDIDFESNTFVSKIQDTSNDPESNIDSDNLVLEIKQELTCDSDLNIDSNYLVSEITDDPNSNFESNNAVSGIKQEITSNPESDIEGSFTVSEIKQEIIDDPNSNFESNNAVSGIKQEITSNPESDIDSNTLDLETLQEITDDPDMDIDEKVKGNVAASNDIGSFPSGELVVSYNYYILDNPVRSTLSAKPDDQRSREYRIKAGTNHAELKRQTKAEWMRLYRARKRSEKTASNSCVNLEECTNHENVTARKQAKAEWMRLYRARKRAEKTASNSATNCGNLTESSAGEIIGEPDKSDAKQSNRCENTEALNHSSNQDKLLAQEQKKAERTRRNTERMRAFRAKKRAEAKASDRAASSENLGDKPYECDVCGKSFSHSYSLKIHLKNHTRDKPYSLKIRSEAKASDRAASSENLGDKPYECDVCGKSFAQTSTLKQHLIIHTGYKPYECNVCGKSFFRSSNLLDHMKVHTGDKPYECDTCEKSFSHLYSLKIHLKNHTRDKPYKCDVCGKYFTSLSGRNYHMGSHAREKSFQCEVCGKSYAQSDILRKHMKIHLGPNYETRLKLI